MLRRRRRSTVGLVLTVVVALGGFVVASAGSAESRPARVVPAEPAMPSLAAAVTASGIPVGPSGSWHVARPTIGHYTLEFPDPGKLAIDTWDTTASVTVRPTTDRTWTVDFVAGNDPVDTAFSFTAVPAP